MIDPTGLQVFFDKLPSAKILVVGDLILDHYVWGAAERISPEAPIPVIAAHNDEMRLGGAGNVAHNLRALGCEVEVVSAVGADADGSQLIELLMRHGIQTAGVQASELRQTTCKMRVLASHQQVVRVDREIIKNLTSYEEQQLLSQVSEKLSGYHAVVLSDYSKGVLTPSILSQIITRCVSANIPVLVDPKGNDFSRYQGATLITPNLQETALATGMPLDSEDAVQKAGEKLLRQISLQAVVMTRSDKGMSLFTSGKRTRHFPAEARDVFDVSGAGDTVIAVLAAGLACGSPLDKATELANLSAGIVVGKLGTSVVTPREITVEVRKRFDNTSGKVVTRDLLPGILEDERCRGKTIVFTNGCFDLLHAGHVKYLQGAKALGDVLVLGLNSDDSIRRLKGPKRPLLKQEERAHILAALDCVDYLVLFEEDTPLKLLRLIMPDILVKGGDYRQQEVVGKDLVEKGGGRVELIEFVEGRSSTQIIETILERYSSDED